VKRRRFIGLAAAGATCGGALTTAACSAKTGVKSVTLTMVAADYSAPGSGSSTQGYWDALARDFHRRHPDTVVDVTVHGWKDVDAKVAELVKAGRPPDIAQIGSYAGYAARGRLYRADELLSIPVQAGFLSAFAHAGTLKRVRYGMPFAASTRQLFYNKTLFAEADLDPDAPPRTWDELADAASRLKAAGVKTPYGLPLGPEEAPAEALLWMLSGGGSYTDRKSGAYDIDSAANLRTFNWLRENLVSRSLTNSDPAHTDRQDVFDAFARGEVAMLNGHPALMEQADRGGVKYGTAAMPGIEGPSVRTLGVADWVIAFKKKGRRQQTGAFLDFVFSEKNHYAFADRYDLLPVTVSANQRLSGDPAHKSLRPFQDRLEGAEFYPMGKLSWSQVSADVRRTIGKVVEPDSVPEDVLGGIQSRAVAEESAARRRL
jgi:multiple sugar transport system substrate-binding protein